MTTSLCRPDSWFCRTSLLHHSPERTGWKDRDWPGQSSRRQGGFHELRHGHPTLPDAVEKHAFIGRGLCYRPGTRDQFPQQPTDRTSTRARAQAQGGQSHRASIDFTLLKGQAAIRALEGRIARIQQQQAPKILHRPEKKD